MPDRELLLPLLAMDDRVILPHMAVPLAIESDAARAAIAAAQQSGGLVLLVPRIDGTYARIGTVARIDEAGSLPDGREGVALRGLYRGVLNGAAEERTGSLWITVDPAPDAYLDQLPLRARELATEYKAILENVLDVRGVRGVRRLIRSIEHPGELADMAGYSPDIGVHQLLEVLQERDVVARLEKLISWSRDLLAQASLKEKIRS